ncbi:hypothetical protein E2C01_088580 [Portunus trituberculatus]|uniref:Uncharacterized protein n=1 Tax=Portunus trituberculatus TaxID=210409 RepID=A0A5B7JB51_PORTR|nr:hypothetical protein [Portunus trituberculatus]
MRDLKFHKQADRCMGSWESRALCRTLGRQDLGDVAGGTPRSWSVSTPV